MTRHAKPPLTEAELDTCRLIIQRRIKPEHSMAIIKMLNEGRGSEYELAFLRDYMLQLAQVGSGENCVCCGGHFQVQYRVINRAQAYAMGDLYTHFVKYNKIPGKHFIKPEHFLRSASLSRELPKLRFHRFVTGRPGNPEAKGIAGTRWTTWSIDPEEAEKGLPRMCAYWLGRLQVPRWTIILHDELVCMKGPLQGIGDVEGFDLEEYMEPIKRNGKG